MALVIDFGSILYWMAIILGGMLAVGAVIGMVTGLFSKENWVRPARALYAPVPWETWFWRSTVLLVVLLVVAFVVTR